MYRPIDPEDGVIRSRVLPGFQFRLDDLCRRPEHSTLRDDPVYADFVLPGWREAEQRAVTEAQARREAQQRAQEAEQALTRLQAQLADRPPDR
ncbi:hypothetical protein [uncultured Lamprocystis sp.]|uniref:hypothetical protein n=1 Tax=uncultured Lamprocystis sp. TaxID=543132 RepID=UPI0025D3016D|nr:hypothetical protein [uncultured Lamprocystis sp.]